nr:trypsin-like peptidase domain-containing protein [Phaeocystidibacter marisrubri]
MMNSKQILSSLGIAVAGGAIAVSSYALFMEPTQKVVIQESPNHHSITTSSASPLRWDNFSEAAESTVSSVVHVKTAVEQGYYMSPFGGSFFGNGNRTPRIVEGSGSGVIISEDGYIVTNNHVIKDAREVSVTTNDNRELKAVVIGSDPTTDIAVLKVEADDLKPLPIANSDDVRLGQWVLAVGNPFNLNSTVTAGIISAKGRSINVIDERSAIESFLQTDAVVNPGNSGGALVNLNGDLVGINTAISTHTGTFEGYSFAVPSNLVQKVVDDIIEYGVVQRAYLGVNISNVTPQLATELDLNRTTGVYIANVVEGSAAQSAGIKTGDVITRIEDRQITRSSELLEVVGRKRPGDIVRVTVDREGSEEVFDLTLTNSIGNTALITATQSDFTTDLGATFEALSNEQKRSLKLRGGVIVTERGDGKLKDAGVPRGFIITKMNNINVTSPEDIEKILSDLRPGDGLLIQGYHPNGRPAYFAFGM